MVVGNIDEDTKKVSIEFIALDTKEFVEMDLDVSEIFSKEELIERTNSIHLDNDKYYKIVFVGNKNIEIDTNELIKYIENKNVIKLKDKTKIKYDLEKISKEQSLRGIFVKELLEQIDEDNKEEILDSIYIGLDIM